METLNKFFNEMDESDLALILDEIGKRMLIIRAGTPSAPFWFGVLCRISRWLNNAPSLNEAEKSLVRGPWPDGVNGKIRAMINLRVRTGIRLTHSKQIVEQWIKENNLPL